MFFDVFRITSIRSALAGLCVGLVVWTFSVLPLARASFGAFELGTELFSAADSSETERPSENASPSEVDQDFDDTLAVGTNDCVHAFDLPAKFHRFAFVFSLPPGHIGEILDPPRS